MRYRTASLILCAVVTAVCPAIGDNTFEGTVSATTTRSGMDPVHFVFTRKGNQLRIENTSNKLEPINILDLGAKRLTIVYPHNTTFVNVDLTKRQQQSIGPGMPAGFPPVGGMPPSTAKPVGEAANASPARTFPGTTMSSPAGTQIGPNLAALPSPPPGFPSPPPMSSIPESSFGKMPNGAGKMNAPPGRGPDQMPPMPAGMGPAAGPGMGMPMMPSMPMPGMFGPTELKKTDKTKKIQGFDCSLYTVSSRGENFEIWAANDSVLFPFQLITRDYIGRRFGPQMLEETWPDLLHNKNLFPFEATLKVDPGGQERLSFKVDKIEKKKIDNASLFQPPDKYIEIQAPQF